MKLFEYAILYHPIATKEDRDKGVKRPSVLIAVNGQDIAHVLAEDEKEVGIRAARQIPDEYLDRLQQIEVAIRPF
jgi:hypothetical protein